MKIRHGFVSNSSSSSFIVISDSEELDISIPEKAFTADGKLPIPNEYGTYSFGWEPKWYGSTLDRVNFTFCQLMYSGEDSKELLQMFEDVLKEAYITPKFIITEEDAKNNGQYICAMDYDFYIDHQSSAIENKNTEMFNSKEKLYDFLFRKGSGIQGGNDN